jgi:hypothetical protein
MKYLVNCMAAHIVLINAVGNILWSASANSIKD